jgi:hypothetical protein
MLKTANNNLAQEVDKVYQNTVYEIWPRSLRLTAQCNAVQSLV